MFMSDDKVTLLRADWDRVERAFETMNHNSTLATTALQGIETNTRILNDHTVTLKECLVAHDVRTGTESKQVRDMLNRVIYLLTGLIAGGGIIYVVR